MIYVYNQTLSLVIFSLMDVINHCNFCRRLHLINNLCVLLFCFFSYNYHDTCKYVNMCISIMSYFVNVLLRSSNDGNKD